MSWRRRLCLRRSLNLRVLPVVASGQAQIVDGEDEIGDGLTFRPTPGHSVVHAERDRDCPMDMAQTVFGKLSAAPYRRWVEIGEGTHSVFLERNRWQVFSAVDAFLDETPRFSLRTRMAMNTMAKH